MPRFRARVRHASQYGGMFDAMAAPDDEEGIVINDQGDINELCDGSCKQSADCPKDHWCPGTSKCFKVRRVKCGTAHRVARSGFGTTAGGKRHKHCKVANAEMHAQQEPIRKANADKRAEEASVLGFDVNAVAPQEIAKATAEYERALAGFGHKPIDVYVFEASTGSGERFSLKNEAVSSIFIETNTNKPILRTAEWSAKKPAKCLVPDHERFSINDSDHVFELADAGRGKSGKELSHRIEKALHIYGEQHAAPTRGHIKPLWRGHGKGYPKGRGPHKIGLLVIERDAAGRLPFGWVRTDGK